MTATGHAGGWRIAGLVAILAAALLGLAGTRGSGQAQESGWYIAEFNAVYRVERDGTVAVEERIVVDFGVLERHGIFRDLVRYGPCPADDEERDPAVGGCPAGATRKWEYRDFTVENDQGTAWKFGRESYPQGIRLKIGDPDRTIRGRQVYVIRYRISGALDAYREHDELYWNVTGEWPVPIQRVTVRVSLPEGAAARGICFVGVGGSTEQCPASASGGEVYVSTRALGAFEQVTVAVGWQKGIVQVAAPLYVVPARVGDYVSFDWFDRLGLAVGAVASLAGVLALWWRQGRDRQYRAIYYLAEDPEQTTKPLFGGPPLVVEYLPPEGLRPAQMGLLLDERADTLDVTATIIDLAVRGYLRIAELPKQGFRARVDWALERLRDGTDLLPYEALLLDALFATGNRVKVSELKYQFADDLAKVRKALYDDAMERGWFAQRPGTAKTLWAISGVALVGAVIGLCLLAATFLGRGLLPAGLAVGALAVVVLAPSMARRTAAGSEMLRRVLGFRLYITTAEKHRQEFNERANIFARYLPFAIVFGCVEKWARAFQGLDAQVQQSTAGWYVGSGPFQVAAFSSGLRTFSSSVGSTLSATRSSGGSGFGGGSAGGGGGGGGGGSW